MIPIQAVSKRRKALTEQSSQINAIGMISNLRERYNYQNIKTLCEHFDRLPESSEEARFDYLLDLLEAVFYSEDEVSKINEISHLITEDVKKMKIRNATALQKHISSRQEAINTRKRNKGGAVAALQRAKSAVGMDAGKLKQSSKVITNDSKKAEAYRKGLKNIGEQFNLNRQCDRILETHAKINQRFNLGKIFRESHMDLESCVDEFCMLLDTYDVPFRAKFNICLENIAYEFDRNGKKINRSDLASLITEHFIMEGGSIYNYQMLYEETSNSTLITKLLKSAQRLSKCSNEAAAGFGNLLLKTMVKLKSAGRAAGETILDLIGKGLGILFILVGIVAGTTIGVAGIAVGLIGIALIVVSVIVGLVMLCVGLNIMVAISPTARKQSQQAADKIKDIAKKNKKAKKLEASINGMIVQLDKATHSVKVSKEDTDLLREMYCEAEYQSNLCDIEHVLNSNRFYTNEDTKEALSKIVYEDYQPYVAPTIDMNSTMFGVIEGGALKKVSNKAKAALAKFKTSSNKTANSLKETIKKIYADSPEHIVDEMPNILGILFHLIVVIGATAINPFLGLITFMVDYFIKLKVRKEMYAKYIKQYKAAREKAKKKGSKLSGKAKENNEAYIKELDKAIERLESAEDDLYTDSENDERKGYNKDDDSSDSDDFDLDAELKEATALDAAVNIVLLGEACKVIQEFREEPFYRYLEGNTVNKSVGAYIAENCGKLYNNSRLTSKLYDLISENSNSYRQWEAYRATQLALKNAKPLSNIYEIANAAMDAQDILNEMSIGNQLTMLKDKVVKTAQTLSDKEKVASRTLDTSIDNLRQGMANSLKQENKEAVIRGQILPPASRIIKLALISGFTFLINPALTVIYLLGVYALSKDIRRKERQIVLDEIDTELKVANEYVNKAKSSGDMQAYRQCLMIEKKLLRQRDRLKYKMNVEYNEKTPDQVTNSMINNQDRDKG